MPVEYVHSPWHENNGVRYKVGWIKNEDHSHDADFNKLEVIMLT